MFNLISGSRLDTKRYKYWLLKVHIIYFTPNLLEVIPSDFMADKLYKQIDLELRAHEPAVLKSYSWFLGTAAKELGVKVERSWAPEEPHKERKTLLKAAYVNKKHRVQYEMRYGG